MENRDKGAFAKEGQIKQKGLTKREYIATAAMQGCLSTTEGCTLEKDVVARNCVQYADALLAKLEDTGDEG